MTEKNYLKYLHEQYKKLIEEYKELQKDFEKWSHSLSVLEDQKKYYLFQIKNLEKELGFESNIEELK